MTKKVFITRQIPDIGIKMLKDKGYEVDVSNKKRPLSKKELIKILKKKPYDAVLSLLTDEIDKTVMDACPTVKIFANYAIGFNNFNLEDAKSRGVVLTNTPGGGADRVAEHTWAFILALTCRIAEADSFMRKGKYKGWDPMIFHGTKLSGKTLGLIGTGRIGADVLKRAVNGFSMNVVYFDIVKNQSIENSPSVKFVETVDEVLRLSDVVSIHVPLTQDTYHLIDDRRLKLMKKDAFIVNTSRGPVIDEKALVSALKNGLIKGAALDVFEFEPKLTKGLAKLSNVVLTPHIASATKEARLDMAVKSATNIIAVLEGRDAPNSIK